MLLSVIMCGGLGSQLWPLSCQIYPKQFLSLAEDLTMLQETVHRLEGRNTALAIALAALHATAQGDITSGAGR